MNFGLGFSRCNSSIVGYSLTTVDRLPGLPAAPPLPWSPQPLRLPLAAPSRSSLPRLPTRRLLRRLRSSRDSSSSPSSSQIARRRLTLGRPSRVVCLLLLHTFLRFGMAGPRPVGRLISHVILDLDGTLLNTDSIVSRVVKPFLVKNGKSWDSRKAHKLVGKTPYEAAAVILEDYGLPYSTEEFVSMVTPLFSEQWCNIKPLPGANRLIKHLRSNGVPTALASNSPRSNIGAKISCHQGWKESFSAIVGGDEVEKGKPSPDIFLEAAKRMNTTPSNCLVIEDSLPGVTAGKAAGMYVIAVPSVPKKTAEFSSADEVVNSLLDVRPEEWGLPPFDDWIEGTLPIEPWFISGPVIKGFGRGSKVLGIPTANLPAESFSDLVSEHTSGVYFGWAGLSTRGIYKMVMSIGWNPYFDNTEKTVEPWLLHDFGEDFYGEELRLAIIGYIRPEANFPSLESLIERIHEDGRIAEKALDSPVYAKYKHSPYLRKPLQQANSADGQADLNSE